MTDLVAAAVAVVGCGEDGDDVPVVGPVVALHHQLVGPAQNRLEECRWPRMAKHDWPY